MEQKLFEDKVFALLNPVSSAPRTVEGILSWINEYWIMVELMTGEQLPSLNKGTVSKGLPDPGLSGLPGR